MINTRDIQKISKLALEIFGKPHSWMTKRIKVNKLARNQQYAIQQALKSKEGIAGNAKARALFTYAFFKLNPFCTRNEFLELFSLKWFPDTTEAGHASTIERLYDSPPWVISKVCPNCMQTAYGIEEVICLFGTRLDGKYIQSYCHECRTKTNKKIQKKKSTEKWKTRRARLKGKKKGPQETDTGLSKPDRQKEVDKKRRDALVKLEDQLRDKDRERTESEA